MTRAVVLGGGGPVGIAWESGLAAGLAETGADLAAADFIMGTSAGSVVGAQLALGRPAESLARTQLANAQAPNRGNPTPGQAAPDLLPLMELMTRAASHQGPPEDLRREIGAFALQAKTPAEDQFIASFGAAIGSAEWPPKRYACTAVDTASGEFVVWDNDSGVPLAAAVASSCSVPGIYPPITINGRRYMDGGMRSATNADLAKGYDTVLVVAVTAAAAGPMAEAFRARLEGELEALRAGGSTVELIVPDAASQSAFGLNLMDFSRRTGAAEAGLAQGRAIGANLAAVWAAAAAHR
jgi:NTE family protein